MKCLSAAAIPSDAPAEINCGNTIRLPLAECKTVRRSNVVFRGIQDGPPLGNRSAELPSCPHSPRHERKRLLDQLPHPETVSLGGNVGGAFHRLAHCFTEQRIGGRDDPKGSFLYVP